MASSEIPRHDNLVEVIRKATYEPRELPPMEIRYAAMEEACNQAVAYLACMMQEGVTEPIDYKYLHKILLRAGDDSGGSYLLGEIDRAYDKTEKAELKFYQLKRVLRNKKHYWRHKIKKQNDQILGLVEKIATARADALDEAARIAEAHGSAEIAAAIRAAKEAR
jgi:hypothetical protein